MPGTHAFYVRRLIEFSELFGSAVTQVLFPSHCCSEEVNPHVQSPRAGKAWRLLSNPKAPSLTSLSC